jgi:predicted transglutaminase-like cysteine proteinase
MQNRASKPALLLLTGAASALSFGAAAHAQSLPAAAEASYSFSKTEAILGAPSALQAILAQQSGGPAPARPAIRPASFSRALMVPTVLRLRPAVSPGAFNGRPDIFGTVALRVGRTQLDGRWHKVEHSGVGGAAARYSQSLAGLNPTARLEAVNRYVNHHVSFVDDSIQYGRADYWAAAGETLTRGRGDCEDYAIAKLQMLRRAGIADRDLYLSIVKDLVRRVDHAILVVRVSGHMYVLDNGTDRLLESESVSDYRPVLTFASNGSWTHGYRVQTAPVNIASNEAQPLNPAADTDDQRSRSASLLALSTGFSK